MAQTYNFDGTKLVIPGAYIKTKVLNENAGVAATGIIALVGEADSGPDYSQLKVAKVNGAPVLVDSAGNRVAFSPDEGSLVEGVFGSGRLVDAFNAVSAPFNGTNALTGTPSLIYVIKTNSGAKSEVELKDSSDELLCKFVSKSGGTSGNDIKATVTTLGDADEVTGLVPVKLSFQKAGVIDPPQILNNTAALKFTSTGNALVTVESSKVFVGASVYLFANYRTVSELAKAINDDSGTTGVSVEIHDTQFNWVSPKGLLDIGEYQLNNNSKWVGVLGWQLANVSFQLVDVADISYAKPDLTTGDTLLDDKNLSGGEKGSTSDAAIAAALDKVAKVAVNFVVPLFSQDASEDAVTDETVSTSTYTLNSIVKNTLQHCVDMSAVKLKKNRQGFISCNKGFAASKTLLNDSTKLIGTPYQFRGSVPFQGVIKGGTEYQPWMVSVLAAAAQAVAGYRPVFNKGLSVDGILNPADYDGSITAQEDALQSGLLTLADAANGIDTIFLSDQTTYLFPDNNFVYNSIQAVYGADVISLTIQQQMQVFVGQSNADVTSGVALAYLQSIMGNLLVNKWIASSSDAPNGYKNAKVSINGPVMSVSLEAKASTGIYFIPINLSISAVKN